jgi:glycerophosphoryl diester phosphodiesterase
MRLFSIAIGLALAALLIGCSEPQSNPVEQTAEVAVDMTNFMNIAHRGARSLAPENTMPAARKAHEVGASGWELDVAMTADGELVLLHDDTLERTSDATQVYKDRQPWRVENFTLAELQQLDFGSWFVREDPFKQVAAGAVTPEEQAAIQGTQIPTLQEALEYTRAHQWFVNVEIKDATGTPADATIVKAVVDLIRELGMNELVLVSSFNHAYLKQVKALQPSLATGALVDKYQPDPVTLVKELGAQAYHPSRKVINAEQIQALRQEGFAVYVWTVNDEDEMRELIAMGVSGIITDYPQLLGALIK